MGKIGALQHFHKIAEGIDISGIRFDLAACPHLWNEHRYRKDGDQTPHSEMSDIWVRYNDVEPFRAAGSYVGFNDVHVPVWYRAWHEMPSLKPIVLGLMAMEQGEMLGGVLITRIPPGAGITKHVDDSWHVRYFEKFYLSIESAAGAVFGCDHGNAIETIEPTPGDLYRFDNRKLHWVQNDSDADRVTLIVCIRTEKYGWQ